jgi:dsRNA-specific ribonuclease
MLKTVGRGASRRAAEQVAATAALAQIEAAQADVG